MEEYSRQIKDTGQGQGKQGSKNGISYILCGGVSVYPVDDVEPTDRFQWGTGFECVFLSSSSRLLLAAASRFTEMQLLECLLVTVRDTLQKHLTPEGLSSGRY